MRGPFAAAELHTFGTQHCPACGQWLTKDGACTACRGDGSPETKAKLGAAEKNMWAVISDRTDRPSGIDRTETGPIDIVWARRGMGVHHIIERREEQDRRHPGRNRHSPEETCIAAVETMALGRVLDSGGDRAIFEHRGLVAIVAKPRGNDLAWLMSAYEEWPEDGKNKRR